MEEFRTRMTSPGRVAFKDGQLHPAGNVMNPAGSADKSSDNAGIRVGISSQCDRPSDRLDVKGPPDQMMECMDERDPDESDLRSNRAWFVVETLLEPVPDFPAGIILNPSPCPIDRSLRFVRGANQV